MSLFLFGRTEDFFKRPAPAPAPEPVADVVFRTERALATHTVTDALVEELMETLVRTRVALAAGERS